MIDLNRVFPGDPDGLLTHQLAHKLFELFSTQCEYFVDFHCGGISPPWIMSTCTVTKGWQEALGLDCCTWGSPSPAR